MFTFNKFICAITSHFLCIFIILAASTWEIRRLNTPMASETARCLVTHTLEMPSAGWFSWKDNQSSKFENSVPFALLCQVAGWLM